MEMTRSKTPAHQHTSVSIEPRVCQLGMRNSTDITVPLQGRSFPDRW